MCSWSYLLLKTTVDYVMKKHINNNCHVLNILEKQLMGSKNLSSNLLRPEESTNFYVYLSLFF
jgi:putative heme iron utilization protein